MSLVIPNAAEDIALKALLNHTAQNQNLTLKLFKNNVTPSETDTVAAYTEADFTGYSSKSLTGASWTVSSGTASYAEQTFTSSTDQTAQSIYGYFVVRATTGELMWAERFSAGPYSIQYNGDQLRVTPQITAD